MNDENMRENIRKHLIELRNNKAITQAELGDIIGIKKKTIGAWEQGHSLPDLVTLYRLSLFYNKPLEYFYGDENEY